MSGEGRRSDDEQGGGESDDDRNVYSDTDYERETHYEDEYQSESHEEYDSDDNVELADAAEQVAVLMQDSGTSPPRSDDGLVEVELDVVQVAATQAAGASPPSPSIAGPSVGLFPRDLLDLSGVELSPAPVPGVFERLTAPVYPHSAFQGQVPALLTPDTRHETPRKPPRSPGPLRAVSSETSNLSID